MHNIFQHTLVHLSLVLTALDAFLDRFLLGLLFLLKWIMIALVRGAAVLIFLLSSLLGLNALGSLADELETINN